MNAQSPISAAASDALKLAAGNADILRAVRDGRHATPSAVGHACGREPKNMARDLAKLVTADLISAGGDPDGAYALTLFGLQVLTGVDMAEGAANPAAAGPPAGDVLFLKHHQIRANPLQPRKHFDPIEHESLKASIVAAGDVLQNLVVFPADAEGVHDLSAGERRWRAVADLIAEGVWPADKPLRAIERQRTPGQEAFIGLVENGQRANLTSLEEARAYTELVRETGWSARAAALKTGRDPRTVQEMLRVIEKARAADIAAHEAGDQTWEWLRNTVRETREPELEAEPAQADLEEVTGRAAPEIDPEVAELMAMPTEQRIAYAAAMLAEYDRAVREGADAVAAAAAAKYDNVVYAFNGGQLFGCSAGRDGQPSAADLVAERCAAPFGEAPAWGQAGTFLIDINGMKTVVVSRGGPSRYVSGDSADTYAWDQGAAYYSNTGYRSCMGLRGPGTYCEAIVRYIVALTQRKDHKPRLIDPECRDRDRPAEWADLPVIQARAEWLVPASPVGPYVVDGVDYGNATRASEARRAIGIDPPLPPANSGGAAPKDEAAELSPIQRLAMIELGYRLQTPDGEARLDGAPMVKVRKYWLDADASELAGRKLLRFAHNLGPDGPHALLLQAGRDWLWEQGVDFEQTGFKAVFDARIAAGIEPFMASNSMTFVTPWLNAVDAPAATLPEVATTENLDDLEPAAETDPLRMDNARLADEVVFWRQDAAARLRTALTLARAAEEKGEDQRAAEIRVSILMPTRAALASALTGDLYYPLCEGCDEPVQEGDAVYAIEDGGEMHVDCDDAQHAAELPEGAYRYAEHPENSPEGVVAALTAVKAYLAAED